MTPSLMSVIDRFRTTMLDTPPVIISPLPLMPALAPMPMSVLFEPTRKSEVSAASYVMSQVVLPEQ